MSEQTFYTPTQAAKLTGCTARLLMSLVFDGKISLHDGKYSSDDLEKIIEEKNEYIGLYDYARNHKTDRFNGDKSSDRQKLHDYLEHSGHFGLQAFSYHSLLTGTPRDVLFFRRADIPVLNQKLASFFGDFARTEEEKIKEIMDGLDDNSTTKKYLRKFIDQATYESSPTPAFTDFVRRAASIPDILSLSDKGIASLMDGISVVITKDYLISFLNYVQASARVKYGSLRRDTAKGEALPAYDIDTYIKLARCIFNAEHIFNRNMIKKALDSHKYAEMWLYLALFFACGWRAQDVCRGWRYLELGKRPDGIFGLHKATLYEDILYDRIPEKTYVTVCRYSLGAIEISGQLPQKTANTATQPLLAVIDDTLLPFYGLLSLIAEVHILENDEGRMKPGRAAEYQNKMNLRAFFGPEIREAIGNQNLQSRRLNKDYLQAIEDTGRQEGYGGILTAALASYARNHKDLNTIRNYLHDHALTGENADMVLYFAMERGVFGFEIYQTIVTAFPDAVHKLTMEEQNKIIKTMNVTPLAIESAQAGLLAQESVKDMFMTGNEAGVLKVLKSMYAISQMRGMGKDHGIYCLKRSAGEACSYPEWDSCLSNACRFLVFTKLGYLTLLTVLREYKLKAVGGDKKAESVLNRILIPRYQRILNQVMKDMNLTSEDKHGLKALMMEELNG